MFYDKVSRWAGGVMMLTMLTPNVAAAQQAGPAVQGNLNTREFGASGFNIEEDLVIQKFDTFKFDAQKIVPKQPRIPPELKQQFIDLLNLGDFSTKTEDAFFADPNSPEMIENNAEIREIAAGARYLMETGGWEGSSIQHIYGRLLNMFDPTIPPGFAASEDRAFFENVQKLLSGNDYYYFHVVENDSKEQTKIFEMPNYPGPPILPSANQGKPFDRLPPYYSDKLGLLPGVGLVVQLDRLTRAPGGWKLATLDINMPFDGAVYPPCPDENSFMYKSRDSRRVDGRVCTGFLLDASDHFVTARHCLHDVQLAIPEDVATDPSSISVRTDQYAVVFGFRNADGVADDGSIFFPDDQVYFVTQAPTTNLIASSDMIELSLDRSVPPDIASPFSADDRALDDALRPLVLTIAGYAVGMPLSIDSERPQIVNFKSTSRMFYVGADNYHGDSGAPVFDSKSGKIIGIMVSGLSDFALRQSNIPPQCYISNKTDSVSHSLEAALHLRSLLSP